MCLDTQLFCVVCIFVATVTHCIHEALLLVLIYAVGGGVFNSHPICTETIMDAQEMRHEQKGNKSCQKQRRGAAG